MQAVVSERTVEIDYAIVRPARIYAIPRAQEYYWTQAWREDEDETLSSFTRGEGIEFVSGRELATWLLSDDDDADASQE
ncbi:MAG: hypothetical protein M3P96_04425 [Actinomycetota bacterium]|nr:hypothetical protein [Actinomycetota bacterium]